MTIFLETRRLLVYILLSIITGVGFGQDPCMEGVYSILPDLPKRGPSFVTADVPLCDRHLTKGWYRAGKTHEITTIVPELFSCGTVYPYWMDGSLPTSGQISTVKMCQAGFDSPCERSHSIRVKNCGPYAVYELTPLDSCYSAYCFERNSNCIHEVPTGVSVTYHNVSWETKDIGRMQRHTPIVNLICNFLPLSTKNIFYEVTWYVDKTEILGNQTVTEEEKENAILTANDFFEAKLKAGSMIHCIVGAKRKATEQPCVTQSSPLFFAGIKQYPTSLEIPRGKSATIYLELTIPFVDEIFVVNGIERNTPTLNVALGQYGGNSTKCKVLNVNNCGANITAFKYSEREKYATDEWKKVYNITVYNLDNGDYTINTHLTFRLKTGGTHSNSSRMFENIFLPDVQVTIIEPSSVWKGKTCSSRTDPNMKTFDGQYFGSQLNGTFILYRNHLYNQEVQEKHFHCGSFSSYVTCNCAVAVRSGRDIFMVDVCGKDEAIINFPLCDDKVLKVRKEEDRTYLVILPTGTTVKIKIWNWRSVVMIDIVITASPSDLNNSRGICGPLDGNSENDFLGRDNSTIYQNTDFFVESWRVRNSENLFYKSHTKFGGLPSVSNSLMRICNCTYIDGEWKTHCSYGGHKGCLFQKGKEFFCILNQEGSRRRKRDLTYLYSKLSSMESSTFGKTKALRNKRQAMMSDKEARRVCLTVFEKSEPFKTCLKYIPNLGNASLIGCITDLKYTGDESFTAFHLEVTLDQCSTFIALNSTFQEVEKDVTHQIQSLCPSNCSGNGVCMKGNCTCNSRYAGSDCSFDLLGPPTISLISNFGFCDKSEEECDEITLYGRYFLENMHTRCYTARRMITENGSHVMVDYFQRNLEERTLFEGYCPLEYDTIPTWVTFFTFNISNDGRNFTENFDVYTYQSLCQEFHNDSGNISFSFKDGYCFVDGRCTADGNSNPKNECDVCNVAKDKYSWTYNEGHCYINGRCIADGEVNLPNLCEVCNTKHNLSSWSISPEFCYINNVCYFDGESKRDNICEICNTGNNRYKWTFNEAGYCLINGYCVQQGERDSKKECYVCNPELNRKAWSLDSDGYCFINNSCVSDGEHDPLQECKVCNPSLNKNDWSFNSGCSTKKEIATTESEIATTELLSLTTAAEPTISTTKLVKSLETSTTLESTVLEQSTMPKTTETKTSTIETKIPESTTKATTHVKQETTMRETTPTTNAPVTEETLDIGQSTLEPIKKETSNAETGQTTATIPTDSKTKEIEQVIIEAKPNDTGIIEDTIAIETSSTFVEMTEQMSLPNTTQSLKTTPTAKTITKQTDLPVKRTTAETTTPDQSGEPTTRTEITTDKVSIISATTLAPQSIETNKPTVFIQEDKTTTVPNTSPTSTESTHSTTSTEDLTAITTCCESTTNIHSEAEKSNVVSRLTILAVSITGPAVFVIVIIAVICGIHCYRRSHGSLMLNSG